MYSHFAELSFLHSLRLLLLFQSHIIKFQVSHQSIVTSIVVDCLGKFLFADMSIVVLVSRHYRSFLGCEGVALAVVVDCDGVEVEVGCSFFIHWHYHLIITQVLSTNNYQ
jgi:hypothetical protein